MGAIAHDVFMLAYGSARPMTNSHSTTNEYLEIAHNPSAWIGIFLCILLLRVWYVFIDKPKDGSSDDPNHKAD